MNGHLKPQPVDPVAPYTGAVRDRIDHLLRGGVGDFLADFLAGRGWAVEKTRFRSRQESATGGARWNVYAGTAGETPDLVFSTHMDTVPPYIPYSEDEEFMYGRGVSDAKGIIAAQVAAAETLRAEGFAIGVLFVIGEERDSAGAKVANLYRQGEPFSDQWGADR